MASPAFDPTGTHTLEVMAAAEQFNRWMYETISPYLKGNILEIGTGTANISVFALKENKNITLSDINPEYREQLKERFSTAQTLKGILSIDLQHPGFRDIYGHLENKFDSIFMLNVIEHLADDQVAVDNCRFMLNNGGHLIVLAPSYPFLYCNLDRELGHYRRYTLDTLGRLFGGQELVRKFYFNAGGITGWFLFGKLLGRKRLELGQAKIYNKLVPLFRIADRILFRAVGLSTVIISKIQK